MYVNMKKKKSNEKNQHVQKTETKITGIVLFVTDITVMQKAGTKLLWMTP